MSLDIKTRVDCKYDSELLGLIGLLSFDFGSGSGSGADLIHTCRKIEDVLSYIKLDYGADVYFEYKKVYDGMLSVRLRLENSVSLLKY